MRLEDEHPLLEAVRPRWLWRSVGLSIPLHVAVFALLYFGGLWLFETESVRSHARDSQLMLLATVDNLHLVMRKDSPENARARIAELTRSIPDVDLRLWSPSGEETSPSSFELIGSRPEPSTFRREEGEVRDFFAAAEEERYWWSDDHGEALLRGLVRVRTDERCSSCHEVGKVLAVASMTRDLSTELGQLHRRLVLALGGGVVIWIALASLIHSVTAHAFRRSAARVREELDSTGGQGRFRPPASTAILDPMSAALFESLRETFADHRRREKDLASRLHHADRLASLGQLAAGLAHEIKNPLAGVQGALEILSDESSDEENVEVYRQMLDELHRVDGTIRTLLRFARPPEPKRRLVDVAELLDETVSLLRPGLTRRNIELEVHVAPNLKQFPLDAEQIRQVLVNLIGNAAEALQDEPGTQDGQIIVGATLLPEEGGLVIAVEDNGPGIPVEQQAKIFQPFHTTKFSGTGLGLAVVDSLVTRHRGEVRLESTPGKGSTFFVLIPLPDSGTPATGEVATAES